MSCLMKKRAKRMIDNDRIGISVNAEALIKRDIIKLLEQYFVVSGNVKVEIISEREKFNISVYADLKDIKRFKMLD